MKYLIPYTLINLIAVVMSSFLATNLFAATVSQMDASKSQVTFVSKQMGVQAPGKFKKFNANVKLDTDKLESTQGSMTIDLASIDTGSKEGNDEVVGKSWFNVKQFPTANFNLKSAKNLGNGKVQFDGDLTVKGKTKTISSIASINVKGKTVELDGNFVFKRLDYAIGEGTWGDVDVVANEVQIRYQLVLK